MSEVSLANRRAAGRYERMDACIGDRVVGRVEFRVEGASLNVGYMIGPGTEILLALVAILKPASVSGGVRSKASYLAAERAFGTSPVAIVRDGKPLTREAALEYLPDAVTMTATGFITNPEEIGLKYSL